ACTTISRSTTVITPGALLTLVVAGLIQHNKAAELAGPVSQTGPEAQSQAIVPEPAALLRSYETSLAAYRRMRGRWTVQLEKIRRGNKEVNMSRENAEWAIFRDHDRFKLFQTMDSGNGREVFETLREGKQMVSALPDGTVLGWLQPSAQNEFDQLS